MASAHLTASVPRLLGDTTARLAWLLKSQGTLVKIGAAASVAVLVETGTKTVVAGKIYLGISAALATAALATGLVVWSRNVIGSHSQEPIIRSQAQSTADATRQRNDVYGDPLPPGALVRLGSMRFRHGTQAHSVACSPDGQLIASGGFQTLRLWEAQTGKPLATLRKQGAHVFSVVFSPDGTRLLSVGSEPGDIPKGTICIWDVRSRRSLHVLEMDQWMRTGDFSPDGRQFAVTGDAGALLLFDTATGKELRRLSRRGFFEALRFSPDGRFLASTGDEKTLNLWNTNTGEVERQISAEPSRCVSFSPDGKTLATTHDGPGDVFPGKGTVCLWDVPTGQKLHTLEGPKGQVLSAAFSPNGKLLAAGGETQVIVWNATTVTRLWDHELTHAWVQGVTFSPDNGTVFAAATDGRIHSWDAKTGKDLMPVEGHSHGSAAVTISIDCSKIATASDDRTARIWDTATGKTTAILKAAGKNNHGLETGVYSADFSLDGKTLVTGGGDGSVRLWDVSRGAEIRRLVEPEKSWYSRAQYSPSGKFIVSGHVQAIRIWDAKSGKEIRSLNGHDGYVVDVCFSPNEKLIASIAHSYSSGKDKPVEDRTVRLWDVKSGAELHRFEEKYPSYAGFRPDGRVVHWLGNQAIRARDVITGQTRQELCDAGAFAYSPGGQWLATAQFDGTIVIRDSQTHRICRNLGTLPCSVTRLIWAADGRRLVSGQEDSTVLVWDLSFPQADAHEFSQLWSDLASSDPAKAYVATVKLAANGDATVRQIRELIRPAEDNALIKQIRAGIANLDSDEFEMREKATEDLRRVGVAAEAALVLTFEQERSQESRSRSTALLNEIAKKNGIRPAESIRSIRALEVLEWIGSEQALDYLRQLAAGAAEAEITHAASSSLDRIGRRIAATHP